MKRFIAVLLIAIGSANFGSAANKEINKTVIDGVFTPGKPFKKEFGEKYELQVGDEIKIHLLKDLKTSKEPKDLIYPVDPPYRFSNHRQIGFGYGQSNKDSVEDTPREFKFLYRESDAKKAWEDINCVLWDCPNRSQEAALKEIESFPTGELIFEILDSKLVPNPNFKPQKPQPGTDQKDKYEDPFDIQSVKFRATLTWPKK